MQRLRLLLEVQQGRKREVERSLRQEGSNQATTGGWKGKARPTQLSRKSRQPSNHAADGGADSYDPKILFWVLVPVAASIIIPTALGYLGDERVPDDKAGFKTELIRQYPYIISFCLLMAALALGNAIIDVVFAGEHLWQAVYAISAAVVLSCMAFVCLPRQLAMCNFYMFIAHVLYIGIGGAQDYWFTASEKCVPGGPAFDYTYYNTYTAVVGSFTGWIGIVIFQGFMSGCVYMCRLQFSLV